MANEYNIPDHRGEPTPLDREQTFTLHIDEYHYRVVLNVSMPIRDQVQTSVHKALYEFHKETLESLRSQYQHLNMAMRVAIRDGGPPASFAIMKALDDLYRRED